MALDSTGTNAYVLTVSGLSIIPLAAIPPTARPTPAQNGVVNLASYQTKVAPGSLIGIFGSNLASQATASTTPLPAILGGTCVTLNNVAIPLMATTSGQINGQIPPSLAAGKYPLVVHSITNQAASASALTVTVAKYAPAVLTDSSGRAAIYHQDGSPVTKDNPTPRAQRLVMYATGLGTTSGGDSHHRGSRAEQAAGRNRAGIGVLRAFELLPVGDYCRMERPGSRPHRRLSDRPVRSGYSHEWKRSASDDQDRRSEQPGHRVGGSYRRGGLKSARSTTRSRLDGLHLRCKIR